MTVTTVNDRSIYTVLESNVRESQACERNLTRSFERNLEESFEKLYNFNKVFCQEVIKTLEDVNIKLDANIRSVNDEIIFDFNHLMMETINKISKQVVIEAKNHIDEKEVKESNFKKTDPKLVGKKTNLAKVVQLKK
jgi:NACalpha-BTF3-like transcription factor